MSKLLDKESGAQIVGMAMDGLEAVAQAQSLQPDLVLMDVGLPKLNGIETARQIRSIVPNSKIIFVSSHESLDYVEEALRVGASGYVLKAKAGSDLARAVEAAFQGKRFVSSGLKEHVSAAVKDTQAPTGFGESEVPLLAPASALAPRRGSNRCHEALFYSEEVYFFNGLTHFVEGALKAGNAAVVVTTESHENALIPRLRAQGLDIAAAFEQERYVRLDAADTLARFMVNDMPDPARFFEFTGNLIRSAARAATGSPPRVAACGECAPLLWAQGKAEAAIRVEQLWNEVAEKYDVDILCAYPSKSFDNERDSNILQSICAEHSALYFL